MREVLRRLSLSTHHLIVLDNFLIEKDNEYGRIEKKLEKMGKDYFDFCRELYFGGIKTRGNPPLGSRQIILSDIFQYIITSRGYYLAARDNYYKRKFVKIVMYLVNQWLLMDCFGPKESSSLRKELMNTLEKNIGKDNF